METILSSELEKQSFPGLLVGNQTADDAAVFDIGGGRSIISTTDFFMPIVDDAFDFGRIAACNAISDIYAMGGQPLMAIAILGWPINKLSAEVAAKMLDGGRSVCYEAGIPLAGGHSIDSPEPIFGLAVTGIIDTEGPGASQNLATDNKRRVSRSKCLGLSLGRNERENGSPVYNFLFDFCYDVVEIWKMRVDDLTNIDRLLGILG